MTAHGEIGLKSRRPSTPGANQQLLFNQGGVDGANANLIFDFANSSLNVTGNIFTSNGFIAVRGSLPVAIQPLANNVLGGIYIGGEAKGNIQTIQMFSANAAVDNAWWEIFSQNTGNFQIRSANDTYGNIQIALLIRRANANSNIGTIEIGNIRDLPNTTIFGNTITTNVYSGNIINTQNTTTGNLSVPGNGDFGNITTANIVASATINVTGSLNVITAIATAGPLTVRGPQPGILQLNSALGGIFLGSQGFGNNQAIEFFAANSALDNAWWEILTTNSGIMAFRTANDTYGNNSVWLKAYRTTTNANIALIEIGNINDRPNVNVYGNVVTTSNVVAGNLSVTQNATTGNLAVAGNVTATNMFTSQLSDVGLIITPNTLIIRTSAGSNANLFLGANGVSFINIGNTQWMNIAGQINVTNTISIAGINISTIIDPLYYNYAGGV